MTGFDHRVSSEMIDMLAVGEAEPTASESAVIEKAEPATSPEVFESEVVEGVTTLAPIKFEVTKSQLTEIVSKIGDVTFDTPANYERGRLALGNLRSLRVGVEKVARSLKDGANDYKKLVDKHSNELIAIISEPEDRLAAAKKVADDEKARLKAEREAAEKAKIEAELRAKREEEERVLREAREAEERRLAEERAAFEAEKARLTEEQRKADEAARLERERIAAEQRAEQERLAAERAQFEAEQRAFREAKEKAEREEFERQAKIQAEKEAAEKLAREQADAEARRVAELERQEAERLRLEALKPDVERIREFARTIAALRTPEVQSEEAAQASAVAAVKLAEVVAELESFCVQSSTRSGADQAAE